jgi:hypothetical protein
MKASEFLPLVAAEVTRIARMRIEEACRDADHERAVIGSALLDVAQAITEAALKLHEEGE